MTTVAETVTYQGLIRVLDGTGTWLLDVGGGQLEVTDPELGRWGGTITVSAGSCLRGKALLVTLELADGRRGRATVDPVPVAEEKGLATLKLSGIDAPPL